MVSEGSFLDSVDGYFKKYSLVEVNGFSGAKFEGGYIASEKQKLLGCSEQLRACTSRAVSSQGGGTLGRKK